MRWVDPETERERWESTKTNIRRDAERIAGQTEKELNEGTYFRRSVISWEDFRVRYETEVGVGLAEKTQQKIKTVFNYVETHINPKRLINVNETNISKMVKALREIGLEEITIKNSLGHLKAVLEWGKTQKLIAKVPDFPKFKRARSKKVMRGRPITLEELERMIQAIPEVIKYPGKSESSQQRKAEIVASWEFYLWGLWWSGLRLEESLKLYWDNEEGICIDLDGEYPMFRIRAEAEKGNKDRLLPMTPEFYEFLDQVPEDERTGPVFNPQAMRRHKDRMLSTSVSNVVADIGEKANVMVGDKGKKDKKTGERKPRFASAHDLRRAFGFRWSRRVKAFELKELMRHENIATTQEYYLEENAQDTARSIWDSCEVNRRSSLRKSSQNDDKQENEASSKVLPDKK
ncbi:tyrosine-type recombinase/integrase [Gimesia maris]|uniref:tyrosine-type recombinase/integrase n=1 Tax=Gimesia maris TaxID=122 RepID=UPI0012B6C6E0|nr:site-specific integrase [Gimesia maris]